MTKSLGWSFLIGGLLVTFSLTWGFWGRFYLESIPIFFFFFLLFEFLLRLRWRVTLICKQCGFDPVIYRKNPELAAQKVSAFLERRRRDPEFLLAPPLHLPKKLRALKTEEAPSALPASPRVQEKGATVLPEGSVSRGLSPY